MMTSYIDIKRVPERIFRKPLVKVTGEIYRFLKLKRSCTIYFRKVNENDCPKGKTFWGIYEINEEDASATHEITISPLLFYKATAISLFKTLCHEMYHCYQSENKMRMSEKCANIAEVKMFKKFYKSFKKDLDAQNHK